VRGPPHQGFPKSLTGLILGKGALKEKKVSESKVGNVRKKKNFFRREELSVSYFVKGGGSTKLRELQMPEKEETLCRANLGKGSSGGEKSWVGRPGGGEEGLPSQKGTSRRREL